MLIESWLPSLLRRLPLRIRTAPRQRSKYSAADRFSQAASLPPALEMLETRVLLAGTGSIEGTVFVDDNSDGIFDAGESPLPGVTVYLDLDTNGELGPRTVGEPDDASHGDQLTNAVPGATLSLESNLFVGTIHATSRLAHPSTGSLVFGWMDPRFTTEPNAGFTGEAGEGYQLRVDFDSPVGQVSIDAIFNDAPGGTDYGRLEAYAADGTLLALYETPALTDSNRIDTMTVRRAGQDIAYVLASGSQNAVIDLDHLRFQKEPSVETDENGEYTITGLDAGSYKVAEVAEPYMTPTVPADGSQTVNVLDGQTTGNVDFGNSISMFVVSGDTVEVYAPPSGAVFEIEIGNTVVVRMNGLTRTFDLATVDTFRFIGSGGSDKMIAGSDERNDSAELWTDRFEMSSTDYQIIGTDIEDVLIRARDGNDSATLHDSPGNDEFTGRQGRSWFIGTGFRHDLLHFEEILVLATEGNDKAILVDSPGNEAVVGGPDVTTMAGTDFGYEVRNFDRVDAYGRRGGIDTAELHDSAGDDIFRGRSTISYLNMPGPIVYARGFERVDVYSQAGGNDRAFLYDASGDQEFISRRHVNSMEGAEYSIYARNFTKVDGLGRAGGNDTATFYDSPGDDLFRYVPGVSSYMTGTGYTFFARGFPTVEARSERGGQDQALLYDTAGDDTFIARETFGRITGAGLQGTARGFARIDGFSRSGNDFARLFDSAGDDTFRMYPHESYIVGASFTNYARNFGRVEARVTLGGDDRAYMYDSTGDDRFKSQSGRSVFAGAGFENTAVGFGFLNAYATDGQDTAVFQDALTGDILAGNGDMARLFRTAARDTAFGFDRVEGHAASGHQPRSRIDEAAVDYAFETFGDWQ